MSRIISELEVAALKREHSALDDEIFKWRQWWEQLNEMGQPHFGEMGDRLAHFREHLSSHFEHEERQGCMSLMKHLPEKGADQAEALRKEHPQLLGELDHLISQLQQCEPAFTCWGSAREEFETFLDQLNSHEESEDALLEQLQ